MAKHRWPALLLILAVMLPISTAQPTIPKPAETKPSAPATPKVETPKGKTQAASKTVEPRYRPFDCVALAREDAFKNSISAQSYRYLVLYNIPTAEERIRYKKALDLLLNSLSRQYLITQTVSIPSKSNPLVLRADLDAYGITPEEFDKLVEFGSGNVPLREPYLYLPVIREVIKIWDGSGGYAKGPYKAKEKTIGTSVCLAEDGGGAISDLIKLTSIPNGYKTKAPIVRGDWFLAYASVAPAYYRLLGLKDNEDEVIKLANLDIKRAARAQMCAITNTKKVTLHVREIFRFPTVNIPIGGYYYETYDTNDGTGETNYLNNLENFDDPVYQAKEIIFSLFNRLQGYAVVNAKRKLLNLADPNVAQHSKKLPTELRDNQIFVGFRNCAICHHGLQSLDCQVRSRAKNQIGLSSYFSGFKKEKDLYRKLIDAFSIDPEPIIAHDNATYETAVRACNGLSAAASSKLFEELIVKYLEEPITLERVARDVGKTPEEVAAKIRATIGIDYTLSGLIQDPPVYADIKSYEERGAGQIMLLIYGNPK